MKNKFEMGGGNAKTVKEAIRAAREEVAAKKSFDNPKGKSIIPESGKSFKTEYKDVESNPWSQDERNDAEKRRVALRKLLTKEGQFRHPDGIQKDIEEAQKTRNIGKKKEQKEVEPDEEGVVERVGGGKEAPQDFEKLQEENEAIGKKKETVKERVKRRKEIDNKPEALLTKKERLEMFWADVRATGFFAALTAISAAAWVKFAGASLYSLGILGAPVTVPAFVSVSLFVGTIFLTVVTAQGVRKVIKYSFAKDAERHEEKTKNKKTKNEQKENSNSKQTRRRRRTPRSSRSIRPMKSNGGDRADAMQRAAKRPTTKEDIEFNANPPRRSRPQRRGRQDPPLGNI